ncbi:MAG: DedA family protein [Deltaproteobacteria bacterium]|nr:DedA family protein [Deltaproteobacteria bacterium]
MLQDLYNWTIAWASSPYAEWALSITAFAEASFFPLPPDLIMIPMAAARPEMSFFFALLCTLFSLTGGMFGYWIGQKGGQPLLHRFIKEERVQRVEQLFNRYDAWAIGIAGFTPIPFKVFTIASGAFRVNFKTFLIASLLGRAGRFFMVAALFYFWGAQIQTWLEKYFNGISIGLVFIIILAAVIMHLLKKKKSRSLPQT